MKKLIIIGLICSTLMTSLVGCSFTSSIGDSNSNNSKPYYDEEFDTEQSTMFTTEGVLDKENPYYKEFKKYYDSVEKMFNDRKIKYYLNEVSREVKYDEPVSISCLNDHGENENLNGLEGLNTLYYDLLFNDNKVVDGVFFYLDLAVNKEELKTNPFEVEGSLIEEMKNIIGINGTTIEKIEEDINSYYSGATEKVYLFIQTKKILIE